jgi:hypothetical protein
LSKLQPSASCICSAGKYAPERHASDPFTVHASAR